MPSKLKISGEVRYLDTPPASGATVRIWDEDGIGGANDDRILTDVTNANGKFSGSGHWQDEEMTFVPDILRLKFQVKVDGKTHEGIFIRINNEHSVPIILPWPAPKPVRKSERELVQVILLSPQYDSDERALYDFIEVATEGLTTSILGGVYNRITFVKGANATLANVVGALTSAAQRPGIEAVDLIFSTHGKTDSVVLAAGETPKIDVQDALIAMPDPAQRKLRMVFSTACFGRTHLDMWIAAGFTSASGSKGVYADSAVSFAPFLAAWAAERTFDEAVAIANAADVLDVADGAARAYYTITKSPEDAAAIDSTRVRAGSSATRIYSTP